MDQKETVRALGSGAFDEILQKLYACTGETLRPFRERLLAAVEAFGAHFGAGREIFLFSAPGRTELCGNHTDHQGGRVLTGSVHLDIIAVAARREDGRIRLHSEGYPTDEIDLSDPTPHPGEAGTSAALLRGIAARIAGMGFPVSGFDAYTVSDVPRGSGLSSSAAFEVLAAKILSVFFVQDQLDPVTLAQIGQYAENVYFGKPCGLMDQLGCAVGGIIAIDFQDADPVITPASVDLAAEGYALCILDSGAGHADLTDAYAAVTKEMGAVAAILGCRKLSQASRSALLSDLPEIRRVCGDRAALRAMHYFAENDRVDKAVRSLQNGYFSQYLEEIRASGHSSFEYLQNISTYADPCREEVALTIALCETLLDGRGAVRVHGGGFAGTVQAYVPLDMLDAFRSQAEAFLGRGSCHVLRIRSAGVVQLTQ